MGVSVKIPKDVYDEMIKHAKDVYPQEACGFAAGKDGEMKYFYPVDNMDHSSVTYNMDPKQQMKAFKKFDDDGVELIGIFHSHVASKAEPSQTDRAMAFYPEVSYLIASLADMDNPDLKSYRINGDDVRQEEINIL
ncbi:MAG: proteasome lid subunit RPN8/RPN11 [Candidatus Omnitrophota bacterium]|jgi:proteasome lid subunit RPN8/RPN11